jgi:hypothetical protein
MNAKERVLVSWQQYSSSSDGFSTYGGEFLLYVSLPTVSMFWGAMAACPRGLTPQVLSSHFFKFRDEI